MRSRNGLVNSSRAMEERGKFKEDCVSPQLTYTPVIPGRQQASHTAAYQGDTRAPTVVAVPLRGAVLRLTTAEFTAGVRRGKWWRRRVAMERNSLTGGGHANATE
jgi:hypothetical protein